MRRSVRVGVTVVLLVVLLGLGVHYGATYDENWPHPTGDQLQEEYDAYVGEQVLLFGEVQTVDDSAIVIHVTDSTDEVAAELTIHGVDADVEPGGTVQVYGVLEADRTMHPDETVVVDRSPTAFHYKLATSTLGILLAIGFFFRYWRANPRALAFEPRTNAEVVDDG